MAGPEKNLYKMVKEKLQDFNPIRIETTTVNGHSLHYRTTLIILQAFAFCCNIPTGNHGIS